MIERIVLFLARAVGDFLSFMLLMRFLMQLFRVSFASPAGEFVLALTNWLVRPLRRVLPGLFGIDWSSLLPVWLIQSALFALLLSLSALPIDWSVPMVVVGGAFESLRLAIWVLIIALIVAAVLSWVNPHSPLAHPVTQLCRPILRPIQRLVPPIGAVDLSPLIAILILNVVLMVLDSVRSSIPHWF